MAKGRGSPRRAPRKRVTRSLRLRTHGTPPAAVRAAWRRALHDSSNVVGLFLGQPQVKGRYKPKPALVCLVDHKQEPGDIPRAARIRASYAWREGARSRRLQSDVVEIKRSLLLQAALAPSETVRRTGERASTGIAIQHPQFGPCITTAGHSLLPDSPDGSVTVFQGGSPIPVRVARRVLIGAADYALLRSEDPAVTVDNQTSLGFRIGPVYVPTLDDIGADLFVIDGLGAARPVSCRGIHAHLPLDGGGSLDDVILTDAKTVGGESGSSLVDATGRVWGLLIGIYSGLYSIYLPAINLLTQEGAALL